MYLIKIQMDRRDPGVRQCLADCQDMHRSLMRWFVGSRQEAGVLYRVRTDNLQVYLYSQSAPDLTAAIPGFTVVGVKNVSDWLAALCEGEVFGFSLLAQPCRRAAQEGQKNSRRRMLRTPEERLAWMEAKAACSGFTLRSVNEMDQPSLFGRHAEEAGGKMAIGAVLFEGQLQITDAVLFRHAVETGIGPDRAYGLGMLLLR